MEAEVDFAPLLLIAVLAVAIPFLSHRLTGGMLPAVVGEVVIGMVFGEPLLDWIGHHEWLDVLALFGFAYLMFLSGLEINLGLLARSPGAPWYRPNVALRHPLISGLVLLVLTAAATAAALWALQRVGGIDSDQAPMLFFILLATAVGVLVPVLKDRPGLGGLGQAVLVSGFLLELAAIIGVGVVAALERDGVGWEMALLLAMPAALGLLLWISIAGGGRFPSLPRTLNELAQTSAQLKIRTALVVLIAFVVLAQLVGTELVLGAFLAGLAATVVSPRHGSIVRVKLDAIGYGFFVPIFFIHAGATLNLGAVFDSFDAFILAPVFLLIAFGIKMLPALLALVPAWGLRPGLSGGALLSANLSLVLAAGAIAEELQIIDEGIHGALLLMALLSTVIAPPLFAALAGRPSAPSEGPAVVIGDGDLARILAPRLAAAGRSVAVIDSESEHDWQSPRIESITGDPLDPDTQQRAQLHLADVAVIAQAGEIEQVETLAQVLRRDHPDLRIVTWVGQRSATLDQLEVESHLLSDAAAQALEGAVLRPGLYQALADPESGFVEIVLRNQSIHGRALRELDFIGGVRVLVVMRAGEAFMADGDTVLLLHDSVTLGGEPEAVAEVSEMLSDSGERRPLLPLVGSQPEEARSPADQTAD